MLARSQSRAVSSRRRQNSTRSRVQPRAAILSREHPLVDAGLGCQVRTVCAPPLPSAYSCTPPLEVTSMLGDSAGWLVAVYLRRSGSRAVNERWRSPTRHVALRRQPTLPDARGRAQPLIGSDRF